MAIAVIYKQLDKANKMVFLDTKKSTANDKAFRFAKKLLKAHHDTLRVWEYARQECPFKLVVNFETI